MSIAPPRSADTADQPPRTPLPLQHFLSADARWSRHAWVFFCVALCLCTLQAVPGWTHPDLQLGWDVRIWFVVIALAGTLTGRVVARYPLPGMVAGTVAGVGSMLAAMLVLEHIAPFSRVVLVAVNIAGMLPGIGLYCAVHLGIERFARPAR